MKFYELLGVLAAVFSIFLGFWFWVVLTATFTADMTWVGGIFFAILFGAAVTFALAFWIRWLFGVSERWEKK